jgi:hypothetical protein
MLPATISIGTRISQVAKNRQIIMTHNFKVGDRVSWNSEAGRVSGTIIRVHTKDFDHESYTHHASAQIPQYEIKSAKTDHIAFHKGSALSKLGD